MSSSSKLDPTAGACAIRSDAEPALFVEHNSVTGGVESIGCPCTTGLNRSTILFCTVVVSGGWVVVGEGSVVVVRSSKVVNTADVAVVSFASADVVGNATVVGVVVTAADAWTVVSTTVETVEVTAVDALVVVGSRSSSLGVPLHLKFFLPTALRTSFKRATSLEHKPVGA